MDELSELDRRVAGVAVLDQPLRRSLYRLLSHSDGWLTRDDVADAADVGRSVAAFHLDKMVDAGILETRFERLSGRSGPGAGRPSKLYRPVGSEVSASVPDRHYDLAGSLLATAVSDSAVTGKPVAECLSSAARAAGHLAGAGSLSDGDPAGAHADGAEALVDLLGSQGYEPQPIGRSDVALANCPFHRLVEDHRELVCGMNLDFIGGVIDGLGVGDRVQADLRPEPGYCCVRLSRSEGSRQD